MTNAEVRERHKIDPSTAQSARSFGNTRVQMVKNEIERIFRDEPEKFRAFINAQIQAAIDGSAAHAIEINNRLDGKVKEQIQVDISLTHHIPDQRRQVEIIDKYKLDNVQDAEYTEIGKEDAVQIAPGEAIAGQGKA